MRHDTKQGFIVIGIVFIPAVIVGLVLFERGANRNIAAGIASAKHSMGMSYQNLAASNSVDKLAGTRDATFGELRSAFCQEDGHLKFSTFIPPENIWLSSKPVPLGSDNLACVVFSKGSQGFGIDARGSVRSVSEEEFMRWPHSAAGTSAQK